MFSQLIGDGNEYGNLDRRKNIYMKPALVKETISIEDFEKLDIRIGTIVSVTDVEK